MDKGDREILVENLGDIFETLSNELMVLSEKRSKRGGLSKSDIDFLRVEFEKRATVLVDDTIDD